MKNVMKIAAVCLVFVGSLMADNPEIVMFGAKKTAALTPQSIEKAFVDAGYDVQVNRDMNGPFTKQFGKSDFAIYNLMTVYYPEITKELVSTHANSGVFAPFSIVIYQKKGDDTIYAGVLSAMAKAKIMGMKLDNKLLQKLEEKNVGTLIKALSGARKVVFDYTPSPLKSEPLTLFTIDVDTEEAVDNKDEVEMLIEDGLKPIGFVMASFLDYNYFLQEQKLEQYTFYDTYSLCKLKVIYTVAKVRPEAGVFAPCTMAVYHEESANKTVVVYPNVFNWMATLSLEDKASIEALSKAQEDIVALLEEATEG